MSNVPTTDAVGYMDDLSMSIKCPECMAPVGVECVTRFGNPVPGWYCYSNDFTSRERHPGVHASRERAHRGSFLT